MARVAEGDDVALLCDHQMAGLNGLDVHAEIVRSRPELAARYVLMSGDVLNPTIEAFVAAHRVGVLAKPFDLETLDRVVRDAMAAGDAAAVGDPAVRDRAVRAPAHGD